MEGGHNVKIEIPISADGSESVIINCRERDDRVEIIENAIENALRGIGELTLYIDSTEYYVPKEDILFFETYNGHVWAHTENRMYMSNNKLFELEDIMPSYFVRISKSAVVNVRMISSLRREITGNGELTFKQSDKKVYFSRGYYKTLKDKIEKVRFFGK
jgi:DNA-binding LytR/AlgR family response regulator